MSSHLTISSHSTPPLTALISGGSSSRTSLLVRQVHVFFPSTMSGGRNHVFLPSSSVSSLHSGFLRFLITSSLSIILTMVFWYRVNVSDMEVIDGRDRSPLPFGIDTERSHRGNILRNQMGSRDNHQTPLISIEH